MRYTDDQNSIREVAMRIQRDYINEILPRLSPSLKPKKIGRNDWINVCYQDGTVKSVKYKKTLPDLNSQKCVLIE